MRILRYDLHSKITPRKKVIKDKDCQSAVSKKKDSKIDYGLKSLHRKKSDVFMPTSVPQITWHLASNSISSNSSLSLNSKEIDKKCEISPKLKQKYEDAILFKKLKLAK